MGKTYKQIAVALGGLSAEREVSLNSGRAVAGALREAGYIVTEWDITSETVSVPEGVEAVFIALHGTFGEDGAIQQILRDQAMPYTGAGVEASRLAFDKVATKERLLEAGLPTPSYERLGIGQRRMLPLPVVVKPECQGSSVGIHRVFDETDWLSSMKDAVQYGPEILVEAFIPGRELTVGIVNDTVLPVLEIKAPEGYYDYRAKYTKGVTQYVVPALITEEEARRCQALAWQAFEAIGCEQLGRVDFRMKPDGELFILELNTIPGFTATSLLPKAAMAAGISFPVLCDRIMSLATVH